MQPVTIYTTLVCPYCTSAKELFRSLGIEYKEVRLDTNPELRMKLSAENKGWRTVPMIFVGDTFLGGFDETSKLHSRGELLPLVGA